MTMLISNSSETPNIIQGEAPKPANKKTKNVFLRGLVKVGNVVRKFIIKLWNCCCLSTEDRNVNTYHSITTNVSSNQSIVNNELNKSNVSGKSSVNDKLNSDNKLYAKDELKTDAKQEINKSDANAGIEITAPDTAGTQESNVDDIPENIETSGEEYLSIDKKQENYTRNEFLSMVKYGGEKEVRMAYDKIIELINEYKKQKSDSKGEVLKSVVRYNIVTKVMEELKFFGSNVAISDLQTNPPGLNVKFRSIINYIYDDSLSDDLKCFESGYEQIINLLTVFESKYGEL
ncbi:MAG: hypothetical protein KAG53_07750 [Endozoicomonadaceae bacterium]|nr:hypothetical protein [Endozoicomonadaceae bacterium]